MYLFVFILLIILTYYSIFDSTTRKIQADLEKLEPNLNFLVVKNNLNGNTFTVAKSLIYICTNTEEYNTLLYVAIHELAHVKNKTLGHDKDFVEVFKELLEKSVQLGIYKWVDYKITPKKYCNYFLDSY